MKRTVIKYFTLNGRVYIKKIENVAGARELQEQFGNAITAAYLQGIPVYKKNEGCKHNALTVVGTDGKAYVLSETDVMGKQEFGEIIGEIKAAGKRLGDLCEQAKEKKVVI